MEYYFCLQVDGHLYKGGVNTELIIIFFAGKLHSLRVIFREVRGKGIQSFFDNNKLYQFKAVGLISQNAVSECSFQRIGQVYVILKYCSDKGLTLEMSATHQIPQAKNIPYQPLLIKPVHLY